MASLYDTGGAGGTFVGGRRTRTNAGYGGYGTTTTGTTETRPNGDTTFGGASDPFGGTSGGGPYASPDDPRTPGRPPGTPWGGNGGTPPVPMPAPAPPAAPNYSWLTGYDPTKLADPTHNSAKYAIGRTLAGFDPRQGITDPVLKALNALGLGTFGSAGGDRLSLSGVTQAGLQAGLDPHNFTGDWIVNWTGQDPNDHSGARWGYDAWSDPATTAATDPLASLSSLFSMPTPQQQPSAPDLSWLGPLLESFNRQPSAAPAPPPVPTPSMPVPVQQPSQSQPTPSFGGGYVTPGYGSVGDATQRMSLAMSNLLRNPQYANDPFVRQLLATIGGGN